MEMLEVQQEVWLPVAPHALQWPGCVLDQRGSKAVHVCS